MKEYTPTKEALKRAREIYDNIVFKQIYSPQEIKEAYQLLYGCQALNQIHAKNMVSTYFQYNNKSDYNTVDKTETVEITTPSIVIDNPTHSESENIIGEIELLDNQEVFDEINNIIPEENNNILKRQLSDEELTRRYQEAIHYFATGNGMIDRTEYRVFQEQLIKKDLQALAHAWLSMVFTFEEYYQKIEAIIGFNLMVLGLMDKTITVRKIYKELKKINDFIDSLYSKPNPVGFKYGGDLVEIKEEDDE